ncbi:MAG: Ig-like domain-containing protein, partial [Pseudohongiellaceae bacterium]
GKTESSAATRNVMLDATVPTVTIAAASPTLKVGTSTMVTFTFSDDPGTFTLADGDVTVSGGTLSEPMGSGLVRTATFTAASTATTASIIVAAGEFMDAAGNPNPRASKEILVSELDPSTPPTFTVPMMADIYVNASDTLTAFTVSGDAGNSAAIIVTITDEASDTATGTDTADGNDGSWSTNIDISSLDDGELTIKVAASEMGKATNTAEIQVMLDKTAPTVLSIAGMGGATATTATVNDVVALTITLSEGSSTFTLSDITNDGGGTLGNFGRSSDTVYTVEFTATTTTATGGISVGPGAFTDVAGNDNTGTVTHTINVMPIPDSTMPTIDALDVVNLANQGNYSVGGTATAGAMINITIADTDGDTTNDVTGSTAAQVDNRWTISGLVLSGLADTALTITVVASEANRIPASASATTSKDTQAPSLTSITAMPTTIATGDTATITFTFDEPPINFVEADIVANDGVISGLGPTSTTVYTATFTAGNLDTTATITVGMNKFEDAAGNSNDAPNSEEVVIAPTTASRVPMMVTLADASNSGINKDTNIHTSVTSPTIMVGNLVAGSMLTLTASHATTTVTINVASVTGTSESVTLGTPNALAEGEWTIIVTHTETGIGKTPSISDPLTLTIDTTAPTVTLVAASTSITATGDTTITVTASEDITGLAQEDFTVTGGKLSNFGTAGSSNRVFMVTFTAANTTTSPTTASIAIKADSYTDIAANVGAAGTAISIAVAAADATYTISDDNKREDMAQEFVVTRNLNVVGSPETVSYMLRLTGDRSAAPNDFVPGAVTGSADIEAGENTVTFTIGIVDDPNDEYDETFVLVASVGGVDVGTGNGTIVNNDNPPTLSVAAPPVMENSNLAFIASLSPASGKTVTVDYATITGTTGITATVGDDYTATSGTLTFMPNSTAPLTVQVTVINDLLHEPDETVVLRFSGATNLATTGFSSGNMDVPGIIEDNETDPTVTINATSSAAEGQGVVFTATLSEASAQTLSVGYVTGPDPTPNANHADVGTDYTFAAGNLIFTPGVTELMFTVSTINDEIYELDETFSATITFSSEQNVNPGDRVTGIGTITNDDAPPPPVINTNMLTDDTYVNLANEESFAISGTATAGVAIRLTVANVTRTTTATGSNWSFTGLDFSDLVDSTDITISVTASETGTTNPASEPATRTLIKDTVAPTVMIAAMDTSLQGGLATTVTFTFSQVPASFDLTDIDLSNTDAGSLAAPTTTGLIRTATFTADAVDAATMVTISVTAGLLTDAAGNTSAVASEEITVTPQPVTPSPTVAMPTNGSYINIDNHTAFTVSGDAGSTEASAVINITVTDISPTTVTVSASVTAATNGSWSTTVDATDLPEGELTFSVTATDGNSAESTPTTRSVTKDITAPSITAITGPTTLVAGTTATITVTVSEPVSSFVQDDIGTTGGMLLANSLVGSGSRYTVAFVAGSTPGTASISVAADTFTDPAGNNNGDSTDTHSLTITPVPSGVSIMAGTSPVTEGTAATFTVTASPAPPSGVTL